MASESHSEKPVEWMGSCKKALSFFPKKVRKTIGYALYEAQIGCIPHNSKPMKGTLREVTEIIANDNRGERTYRAAYCAKLGDMIYMLHVFQKKSRHGIQTPKSELQAIEKRLKEAREHYEERKREQRY